LVRSDDPALLRPLHDRRIAVIGYGNQGRAHALNLRDSGLDVIIGSERDRRGFTTAQADGFPVVNPCDGAASADLVICALPDEVHAEVVPDRLLPAMRARAVFGVLHGFSIHFGELTLPDHLGVILVAPKGPGTTLRERYQRGEGIPALVAVHADAGDADHVEGMLRAWGAGIGCARAGLLRTTMEEEAVSDLFGEQAVLCGGIAALMLESFELLRERGFDADIAYIECVHELKQVTDLLHARGLDGMMSAISNTAEFGAHVAANTLRTPQLRRDLAGLLDAIRAGDFGRRLREDRAAGHPWFDGARASWRAHPIEDAGRAVRSLMPWLANTDDTSTDAT